MQMPLDDQRQPHRKRDGKEDEADDHPGPHVVIFRLNLLLGSHDPNAVGSFLAKANSLGASAVPMGSWRSKDQSADARGRATSSSDLRSAATPHSAATIAAPTMRAAPSA